VDRDSGTDRAIGGWLQRLVRPRNREIHNKTKQIPTLANRQAAALARRANQRELNPNELPESCSSKSNCSNLRQPKQRTQASNRLVA